MIERKKSEEPEFKTKNVGIEAPISGLLHTITEMLGIPLISDVNELRGNFILFVKTPYEIKTVEYLKNAILAVLESNQKIVLAYEVLSDQYQSVKKVLNDPEKLKFIRDSGIFPETAKKEFDVFIEIEERYKDRFEIEPIGVYPNDMANLDKGVISEEGLEKYAEGLIVKEALDLYERYKDTTTVLFYTYDINVSNILDKIENNIKWGRMKKEDTAKICVFVPPNEFTPPKNPGSS